MNRSGEILPIFERDTQLCLCGHTCGQHSSTDASGEPTGIGLGQCGYGHNRRWESELDLIDPPCDCTRLTL